MQNLVTNIRHFAIHVRDIEKGKTFYLALGSQLIYQDTETGPFIADLLGVDEEVELVTCKLRFADGSRLELMQTVAPLEHVNSSAERLEIFGIGLHHLAFTVTDIDVAIDLVRDLGGEVISEPRPVTAQHSTNAVPALHAYCRDPFGNLLHLAQDTPKKIQQEEEHKS